MSRGSNSTVKRGTTVSLSAIEIVFPHWLGASNVNNLFLPTQTSVYTQKYQPAHLLSLYGTHTPPPSPKLRWACWWRGKGLGHQSPSTGGRGGRCAIKDERRAGVMESGLASPPPSPPHTPHTTMGR